MVSDEINDWKKITALLHQELPEIDDALSQANVPVSARKLKSFDFIRSNLLQVSDWDAFLFNEAHGRLLIITEDWFRSRYGDVVNADENYVFVSMVPIRETPFALRVPTRSSVPGDKSNTAWMVFPASVQVEEDPLDWIHPSGVVRGLSSEEREVVGDATLATSNLVRSIAFDLQLLEHNNDLDISELAGSVRSDLQSSARNLCGRHEAGLRSAAWDASQATEKALKLLIRRKGDTPIRHHKLPELADHAERLGAEPIDRLKLALILSGSDAPAIRYGGNMTLPRAIDGYEAALAIIKQAVFEAKPDTEFGFRDARIEVKRHPMFDFDIEEFRKQLRD